MINYLFKFRNLLNFKVYKAKISVTPLAES